MSQHEEQSADLPEVPDVVREEAEDEGDYWMDRRVWVLDDDSDDMADRCDDCERSYGPHYGDCRCGNR